MVKLSIGTPVCGELVSMMYYKGQRFRHDIVGLVTVVGFDQTGDDYYLLLNEGFHLHCIVLEELLHNGTMKCLD